MSLATSRRMNGGIAGVNRKPLTEQQRATEQLRALAKPYRFRLRADAEGFPIIPGRYAQNEWCAARDLAVYSDRPRVSAKLWPIPVVRRHQTGDTEMRPLLPLDALDQVASLLK